MFFKVPNAEEISGTLQGFKIKFRKKGMSSYREIPNLSSSARKYTISGLDVFSSYYIIIAVISNKGTGRFTPELLGTTGELGKILSMIFLRLRLRLCLRTPFTLLSL